MIGGRWPFPAVEILDFPELSVSATDSSSDSFLEIENSGLDDWNPADSRHRATLAQNFGVRPEATLANCLYFARHGQDELPLSSGV